MVEIVILSLERGNVSKVSTNVCIFIPGRRKVLRFLVSELDFLKFLCTIRVVKKRVFQKKCAILTQNQKKMIQN